MTSLVRFSLNIGKTNNFLTKKELKLVRTITGKLLKTETTRPPKPKPWPYTDKSYSFLNSLYDRTTSRFDENTKIIVVEGPVAAGKSKLAKQLAEDLEMLYLPEANLDMIYTNKYGFDLKTLDNQLPDDCKSFDVNNFLMNPRHKLTASFQIFQYTVKYSQYIDALAHLMSTGQGVVLDRCVYSDFVFTEAMYKHGYLSRAAYNGYYEVRKNSIDELLRPHLVVYLDVPVPKVLDNIKKRAISCECNSPALTPQYLTDMERQYKQNYLKEISKHAELLVYDWSEEGDAEVVVEDIERIDFDRFDIQDIKMIDWNQEVEEDWAVLRRRYADQKDDLMQQVYHVPLYKVPEMQIDPLESKLYYETIESAPGMVYDAGFNSQMGDKGVLFKTKPINRDTLPRTERKSLK